MLIRNKKSHWFQAPASKLVGDQSGNFKMPNGFLQKTCKGKSKTKKVNISIEFYIFELV